MSALEVFNRDQPEEKISKERTEAQFLQTNQKAGTESINKMDFKMILGLTQGKELPSAGPNSAHRYAC